MANDPADAKAHLGRTPSCIPSKVVFAAVLVQDLKPPESLQRIHAPLLQSLFPSCPTLPRNSHCQSRRGPTPLSWSRYSVPDFLVSASSCQCPLDTRCISCCSSYRSSSYSRSPCPRCWFRGGDELVLPLAVLRAHFKPYRAMMMIFCIFN